MISCNVVSGPVTAYVNIQLKLRRNSIKITGVLCYADVPRPEAPAVIQRLRDRGIRDCVMVTGDSRQVAEVIARQVGIEHIAADVFPEQKAEMVRALQAQGHVVAVVGDGINDSPALAYADVSVSLKAGSDVARETADVVLHGDLHGLPEASDLARQAMRLIRQNLTIIGLPNAAGMLLASMGLIGPVAATALNNGSNVTAAFNGLRPLITDQVPNGTAAPWHVVALQRHALSGRESTAGMAKQATDPMGPVNYP